VTASQVGEGLDSTCRVGEGRPRSHARLEGETGATKLIGAAMARGEDVNIPGFGIFTVVDNPERDGRNPQTGASGIIVFQPFSAWSVVASNHAIM
jgi:hypothetical protein